MHDFCSKIDLSLDIISSSCVIVSKLLLSLTFNFFVYTGGNTHSSCFAINSKSAKLKSAKDRFCKAEMLAQLVTCLPCT